MQKELIRRIGAAKTHVGAKVALICNNKLVTYLRDDIPHIHDPNLWDFPGGEREIGETALDCVIRETEEEFGIVIEESVLIYASDYKSHQPERADVAFFVGEMSEEVLGGIRFGDEGQLWCMMPIEEFLTRDDTIKELRRALRLYLQQRSSPRDYA